MFYILWVVARIPCVCSATVNGFFYFSLGAGPYLPWVYAIAFFSADLVKPELFRSKRNRLACRLGGCVLVLGSLAAAGGLFVNERYSKQHLAEGVEARMSNIRAELQALPPSGSREDIATRIASLTQSIEDERAAGGCGPKCRALQVSLDTAQVELSIAQRKAELNSALVLERQGQPVHDAQVMALARAIGSDSLIAAAVLCAFIAVVLEAASVLAPLAIEPVKRVKMPENVTELETVRALRNAGKSQTEIAGMLGVSQATVSRRLKS